MSDDGAQACAGQLQPDNALRRTAAAGRADILEAALRVAPTASTRGRSPA